MSEAHKTRLREIGFSDELQSGETVLPQAVGRTTEFNAEGKFIRRTDLPMETAYRQIEWSWTEWHGRQRYERTEIRDVPYQRYQREFVPPPSVELSIAEDDSGNRKVVAPAIEYSQKNEKELLHTVNLFLEIFGEVEILDQQLHGTVRSPLIRLNWTLLPPGRLPWERMKVDLQPMLKQVKAGNAPVINHRLEVIDSFKPDFAAVGQAGFRGYVVMGFTQKGIYLLESVYYGNATYVFEQEWEELSKLTKAEILSDSLQKARIIHRVGWDSKVREILKG